jgi:hypothetical protein
MHQKIHQIKCEISHEMGRNIFKSNAWQKAIIQNIARTLRTQQQKDKQSSLKNRKVF